MRFLDAVAGHVWTLAPVARARLRPRPAILGQAFETRLHDPRVGAVRLTGLLSHSPGDAPLLMLVHGLGGSIESPYMTRIAHAAQGMGFDTLMLNLRGADRSGEDIYHAGLTVDLDAALASDAVSHYRRIVVLGCSMGGHVTLRWGLAPSDSRVRAIGSLCAPLDLKQGAQDIDAPTRLLYRNHVLMGLKEIYASAHARSRVPTALGRIQGVRTIRAWDELAVVPRFGFDSAEHYWHEAQVAPHLTGLALPSRIVVSKHDPMVLARPLLQYLGHLPQHVEVDWVEGGHLGFGFRSRVESDLLRWLHTRALA